MIWIALAILLHPLMTRVADAVAMRLLYGKGPAIPLIGPMSDEEIKEQRAREKEREELMNAALRKVAGKEDWKP